MTKDEGQIGKENVMPQVLDRRRGLAGNRDQKSVSPPGKGNNGNGNRAFVPRKPVNPPARNAKLQKPEPEILFQKYFKSVGPRTYAAQLKRAGNGNHFLVLTEGKRDEKTAEVRKTKVFVFSEDFVAFFRMLHETAQFIRANPVPDEVRGKRERFWAKHQSEDKPESPRPARPALKR